MTHLYTLLVGGIVIPGPEGPDMEAIAWADDTVIGVGSGRDLLAMSRGDSHVVDLHGAAVVPLRAAGTDAWPANARLEVGARADLAVLGSDPRVRPPGGEPLRTLAIIRDGRVVWGELPGSGDPHATAQSGPAD